MFFAIAHISVLGNWCSLHLHTSRCYATELFRNRMHQVKLHQTACMANRVKWIRCKLQVVVDFSARFGEKNWRLDIVKTFKWSIASENMICSLLLKKTHFIWKNTVKINTMIARTTNGCRYSSHVVTVDIVPSRANPPGGANMLQLCNQRKKALAALVQKMQSADMCRAFHIFGVQPEGQWNQADSCWRRFQHPTVEWFPDTSHSQRRSLHRKLGHQVIKYDSQATKLWHVAHVEWEKLPKAAHEPIIFWNRGSGEAEASLHPCVHANSEHSTALSRKFKGFLYRVGENCLRHGIHPEKLRKVWSYKKEK